MSPKTSEKRRKNPIRRHEAFYEKPESNSQERKKIKTRNICGRRNE